MESVHHLITIMCLHFHFWSKKATKKSRVNSFISCDLSLKERYILRNADVYLNFLVRMVLSYTVSVKNCLESKTTGRDQTVVLCRNSPVFFGSYVQNNHGVSLLCCTTSCSSCWQQKQINMQQKDAKFVENQVLKTSLILQQVLNQKELQCIWLKIKKFTPHQMLTRTSYNASVFRNYIFFQNSDTEKVSTETGGVNLLSENNKNCSFLLF